MATPIMPNSRLQNGHPPTSGDFHEKGFLKILENNLKLFIITPPVPLVSGRLLSEVGALKIESALCVGAQRREGRENSRDALSECYS